MFWLLFNYLIKLYQIRNISCDFKLTSRPYGSRVVWILAFSFSRPWCNKYLLQCDSGTVCQEILGIFTLSSPANYQTYLKSPYIKYQVKRVRRPTLLTLNTNKTSGPSGIPALLVSKCSLELVWHWERSPVVWRMTSQGGSQDADLELSSNCLGVGNQKMIKLWKSQISRTPQASPL